MRHFARINWCFASTEIDEAYIDPSTVIGAKKRYLGLPGKPGVVNGVQLLLESGATVTWAREWSEDWQLALWLLLVKAEL